MRSRAAGAFYGLVLIGIAGTALAGSGVEGRGPSGAKSLVLSPPPGLISIRSGDGFSMNVTVTGGTPPYTYQWERRTAGAWEEVPAAGPNPVVVYPGSRQVSINRDISGSDSAELHFARAFKNNGGAVCQPLAPVMVLDEGEYRVYVTDSVGSAAYSEIAHVSIDDTQINLAVYPETARHYVGDTAYFSMMAVGGHGPYVTYPPDGYQFAWEVNHAGAGSGIVEGCVSMLSLEAGVPAVKLVTGYAYDYSSGTWARDDTVDQPVHLMVREAVSVTPLPFEHRNVGQTMTFEVTASGGYPPYAYQWKKRQGSVFVALTAGAQPSGSVIR